MKSSKNRHDGGAYRRCKTMITAHAKKGKDRSKARRHQRGKKGKPVKEKEFPLQVEDAGDSNETRRG